MAGLTRSVIALGAENGVQYIDIRLSGTANATEALINFESPTQTVASNGQVWTNSCFLKSISAPAPYTGLRLSTVERTSGGIFVASGNSPDLTLTSTLNRFSFTRTLSGGGTVARVQSRISFGLVSGTAYNFTVRIGYPQMELGSVATSVIPTTAGTGSRSADVISVTGAVSGSIGQTEGTVYMEVAVYSANKELLSISSGGVNGEAIRIQTNSDGKLGAIALVSNSQVITTSSINALNFGQFYKVAFAYKLNDYTLYIDGVVQTLTDVTGGVPVNMNKLAFARPNDSFIQDQRVRAAALYTTRLTNAELAALTA